MAQQPEGSGKTSFETRCVLCHSGDGGGTDRAPSIQSFVATAPPERIADVIRNGIPAKGMPAFDMPEAELQALVAYARTLKVPEDYLGRCNNAPRPRYGRLRLFDGSELEGLILNESGFDASIRTEDGKIHLLRGLADGQYREAKLEPHADWASYHGSYTANRHSRLKQIDRRNVEKLRPAWFFPIADARMVEGTPVVIAGVMYVTSTNQVFALDAETGREIWRWAEPRTPGLMGDASIGVNRGVAVKDTRVFFVTDHAHVVALDRSTGEKLWDSEMADYREHYGATAAPLVVGDLVIAGVSGGDTGMRGFLDAYHVATGKRAWRFWTIPKPGEPGSETWGDAEVLERGCGATWLTGSYDPELDLLYWPTGNPCPDLAGERRPGDNLYTNSVVALKPSTGEMQWYFQFTPHDTHDWDAQEPLLLIDEQWRGEPRKLLVQANRNGILYVLDRVTGQFLMGEPFAKQTWTKGFDAKGRPIPLPGAEPTAEGVIACPAIRGATNWFSTAYNPETKLFYLLVHESCNEYKKADRPWERGKGWLGGTFKLDPGHENRKYIRALDIQTGKTVWEYAQTGRVQTYSGVLSTAGGLLFFGEDSGAFAALDAATGKPVWHFQANQNWKASPMTYMVGGKQYVAIASGMGFWSFALPQ